MKTNNYIKCALNEKNAFRVSTEFTIFNTLIKRDDLKIDTGCGYTSFPVKTLGILTNSDRISYKTQDILNGVKWRKAYGIETGGTKHKKLNTFQDKLSCEALNFQKKIIDFSVNGVKLNVNSIFVNYNRNGNLLLGMDILKDWDIHIGTIEDESLPENGQTIFLGCPRDQINDDYLLELERLFGIHTIIDAAILRKNHPNII